MGPSTPFNYQTAEAVRTAAPNAVNVVFNELLRRGSTETEDPFAQWMGAESPNGLSGAPISRIKDLTKSPGEKINFTKMRGLNPAPRVGEDPLMGNETIARFGTHDVTIDYARAGTAYTRRQIMLMAAGKGVPMALADTVGRIAGLIRRDFIMQRLRERVTLGRNLFFPTSGRSSVNALQSTDKFTTDTINRSSGQLLTIGGKPISSRKLVNGATVAQFLYFGPNAVLTPLWDDATYNNASQYSAARGDDNVLFSGGFQNWRGNRVFHWNVINEDTTGPIGSYFNPEAELGVAVAAGTAALALKGGGVRYLSGETPAIDYFRYFPGGSSIGKQYTNETRASDTGDYFIKAIVTSGADAGKWGFFRYVGDLNIGTGVTTDSFSSTTGRKGGRLGGTANAGGADTRDTTCGYVAWDSTKNTEALPVGTRMYLANAYGNVIGYVGVLGSDSVLLAEGGGAGDISDRSIVGATNYNPKRGSVVDGSTILNSADDYGMRISIAMEMIFGVDVPKNTAGEYYAHGLIPCVYTPQAGGGL